MSEKHTVVFEFPTKESRDDFILYFSNCAEQTMMVAMENEEEYSHVWFDYSKVFYAWGATEEEVENPVIVCKFD